MRMMIQVEDQVEKIPAESFLQQAVLAVSLIGGQVHLQNESSVIVSGRQGAELEFLTTTNNPKQTIRSWALSITLVTKAISIQCVSPDPNNFDLSLIKNIVRTLNITEQSYDVTVRAHTVNQHLSVTLPHYTYHIRKPYSATNVVLSAATMTGTQVNEMIEVTTDKSNAKQFLESYKKKFANNASFLALDTIKIARDTITAQLFSYKQQIEKIDYRFIDAIFSQTNGVNYVVSCRSLAENFDSFKTQALQSIASIAFNEKQNITKDTLTYTNGTHKFRYETDADVVIKQHSISPIVTFHAQPQLIGTQSNDLMIAETQVANKNVLSPIASPSVLKEMVMMELQEEQQSVLDLISEKTVTIDNYQAIEVVYCMREPMTQQNVVFVQTTFVKDNTNVFSIKSWTLEAVYNQNVYDSFRKEHATFRFL
jgi:TusA-related sulfurtransferase